MLNPNHVTYSEAQVREMQRRAEQHRLVVAAKRAQTPARPVAQRLLTAVGRQMVESGRYLMSKGESAGNEAPEWEYIDWVAS